MEFFGQTAASFDLASHTLRHADKLIKLSPKCSLVLNCLAKADGEVVTRDDLYEEVWPDSYNANESLSKAISELRKGLSAIGVADEVSVKTIAKSGYKLEIKSSNNDSNENRHNKLIKVLKSNKAISITVTITLALIIFLLLVFKKLPPNKKNKDVDGIAVLMVKSFSDDKKLQAIASGLTEGILHELANVQDLRVVARTSSEYYQFNPAPITEISKELNVSHIIEGSLQKSDDLFKITLQLIDGGNFSHVWSKTFTYQGDEIFEMQQEIALYVADYFEKDLTNQAENRSPANISVQ